MHVILPDALLLPTGELAKRCVVVDGDRIVSLPDAPPAGMPLTALPGKVLVPALLDAHVHINEPGRTEWEGFTSATQAAAAGGIATIVDMPLNSDPVTTSLDALQTKLAATPGKLWVDVGFWGGVVPGNQPQLAPMLDHGALGFKCFLCHSGIDDFPASDADTLRKAMPILRAKQAPLLVHAELEFEIADAIKQADPRDYLTYLHSRPKEFEERAIAMMIDLCRETGCAVHIVHLSAATALPMIRRAKREGLPITVETCPHYLCLKAEEVPDGDTTFKCAPPIREDANREALWAGLADGTIDTVISDHSPCIPGLKLLDEGDFMGAWGGIASLQLGFANVWTEARKRGFALHHVLQWMASGPAKQLGWQHHRGQLAPGYRADLAAIRPDEAWQIRGEALLHRHKLTPYEGRPVTGKVTDTWVRGEHIFNDGQLNAAPTGRVLRQEHP